MKLRFLTFLSLGLSACNGGSPDLPELKGRFLNRTPFANSDFEISAMLSCYSNDLMGWRHSCGNAGATVTPSPDGSFTIEPLHVPSGSEYEFTFSVTLSEKKAGKLIYSRRTAHYDFNDDFTKIAELANLSAIYLSEQKLIFRPTSGMPSDTWADTLGKDAVIRYSLGLGGSLRNLFDIENTLDGSQVESIAILPERILFTNRALPDDAPIALHGELMSRILNPQPNNGSTVFAVIDRTISIPSAPTELPAEARTFSFDDSTLLTPTKSIDGHWKADLEFHGNYAAGSELTWYHGTLETVCVNGKIQGRIELMSRDEGKKGLGGTFPVSGGCGGEHGVIEFTFRYATNVSEQKITIPFARIRGNSQALLTNEVDHQEVFDGKAFSPNLAIHDESGNIVGRGMIER